MPRRLAKLFVLSLAAAACGDGGASTGAGGAAASSSGFFPGNSASSFMCAEGGAPSTDASVASSSDGSSIASTSAAGAGGGATSDCIGLAPVSYANDVVPVLAGCTGEQCHAVPTPAVLVEQPSPECCGERLLVKPGDPRDSYLLDKIEGVNLCAGGRMPLGGAALPASDQLKLRAWICEGAPSN